MVAPSGQHSEGQDDPQLELPQLQDPMQLITAVYWCDIPAARPIEDVSTDAGRHFRSAIKICANSVGAPVYWGRTVENPNKVICVSCKDISGFDTREAHITGQQEPWRFAASKLFLKNCLDYPTIHHVDFRESPIPALDKPVTMLGVAYFGADESWQPACNNFESIMRKYNAATLGGTHGREGAQYVYAGWALEKDTQYACFDGPQRLGKAFYFLSGWPSIEAQLQFHMGEGMEEESLNLLNGGADGWRLMHVAFRKVDPDIPAV